MTRHEAIKALIVAVQSGKKIRSYTAVRAILLDGGNPFAVDGHGRSLRMREGIELVKEVWLDLHDRPAYIAGMFAPETFLREQDDGQETKQKAQDAQPEDSHADSCCAALDTQRSEGGYGGPSLISSGYDKP